MAIFYPFLKPKDAAALSIIRLVFSRLSDSLSTVFRTIRSFSAVHKVTAVASLRLELKVFGEPVEKTIRIRDFFRSYRRWFLNNGTSRWKSFVFGVCLIPQVVAAWPRWPQIQGSAWEKLKKMKWGKAFVFEFTRNVFFVECSRKFGFRKEHNSFPWVRL